MKLRIERIYGSIPEPHEYRVLVDRLWPRGVSKQVAVLDLWEKEIAPSTELRKWFGHIPEKFLEFEARYLQELKNNPAVKDFERVLSRHADVVLLYGAKDQLHNEAMVLQKYLSAKAAGVNGRVDGG